MKEKKGIVLKAFLPSEDRDMRLIFADFSDDSVLALGRGNGSEIQINDLTVSRRHAEFSRREGKYYISDTNSKFGTQILWKSALIRLTTELLALQTEKSLFFFRSPIYSFKMLCCKKNIKMKDIPNYDDQICEDVNFEDEFNIKECLTAQNTRKIPESDDSCSDLKGEFVLERMFK